MTDSKTAERKKLSVIKPGHWRNKWLIPTLPNEAFADGVTDLPMQSLGSDEWLSGCKWPTAELAEQKAFEDIAAGFARPCDKYLGPVFFPDP